MKDKPHVTPGMAKNRSPAFQKRNDLIAVSVRRRHETAVVVKDPIALTYSTLRDDEYFVLTLLDGQRSLEQLCELYMQRYRPRTVKPAQLNDLIFRLHQHGLVVSPTVGQAEPLSRRARKRSRERRWQSAINPLFIRFPGVDPDRFLNCTIDCVRPLLHPIALTAYLLLAIAAMIAFANHAERFGSELRDMQRWFQLESVLLLGAVIGGVKVLHELGHAYVCKHFGGECHTIGPMLLFFTPALYCDTSDSWMLRNRWQRVAVGAAGIGMELLLASLATFVWLSTATGLVHYAAMNIMLVCSISTVLINANPLLRYDGYFILCDLWDQPNLAQTAQQRLNTTLTRWFLTGATSEPQGNDPSEFGLLLYAASAWLYRWTLTLTILYLLTRLLIPVGLESVGNLLCLTTAAAAIFSLVKPMFLYLMHPIKRRRIQMARVAVTTVGVGLVVATALVPLPARLSAVATLVPQQSQRVYVSVAGFVESSLPVGQSVQRGDTIAVLRNPTVELDYATAKGKYDNQHSLVDALRAASVTSNEMGERLPAAEAVLRDLQDQLQMQTTRKEALTLRATSKGRLMPGQAKPASEDDTALGEWTDFATDAKNVGCFVRSGTELYRVVEGDDMEAELLLSQSSAREVARGAQVKLRLDGQPGPLHHGTVLDISRRNMSTSREEIDNTEAQSALLHGTAGLEVQYMVRVHLDGTSDDWIAGQRGDASIEIAPKSLTSRIYEWLAGLIRMR